MEIYLSRNLFYLNFLSDLIYKKLINSNLKIQLTTLCSLLLIDYIIKIFIIFYYRYSMMNVYIQHISYHSTFML